MGVERRIKYRLDGKEGIYVGTLEGLWQTNPGASIIKMEYFYQHAGYNRRWRDIPGYIGLYQCSSLAEVKSLPRIVKKSGGGYRTVSERILIPKTNDTVTLLDRYKKRKKWTCQQIYKLTFK